MLSDISWGEESDAVRDFIVAAYVRGGACGVAQNCEFDGSTAIFTKRRYRDAWNRIIVRRCAKEHNHSLKIKGRVRARGARGQHWYNDRRTELARKNSRTQALWYLHLAGDWAEAFETEASAIRPHMMRVMLVSNLALDQRFACVDGISEYPVNYFCQASIPPPVGVPGPALEYDPCPGLNLLHQLERDTGKVVVLVSRESRDSQSVTEFVSGAFRAFC